MTWMIAMIVLKPAMMVMMVLRNAALEHQTDR